MREKESNCVSPFCECEVDLCAYVCACAGMCICHTCYGALSSAVRKSAVTMGTLKCVALQVMWSKISPLLFVLTFLL